MKERTQMLALAPLEPNTPDGSPNSALAPLWPGALLLIAVSLLFYSAYWDRFIGASSGGIFPYTSQLIRAGQVPYRDFCFLIPPLHPLKLAAIIRQANDGGKDRIAVLAGNDERLPVAQDGDFAVGSAEVDAENRVVHGGNPSEEILTSS